jgi:hypothetical protein
MGGGGTDYVQSLFGRPDPDRGDSGACDTCIDLHGLSTVEARAAVLCLLKRMQQLHRSGHPLNDDLTLITGAGRHSADGVSHLREAVMQLLGSLQLEARPASAVAGLTNEGRVVISAQARGGVAAHRGC